MLRAGHGPAGLAWQGLSCKARQGRCRRARPARWSRSVSATAWSGMLGCGWQDPALYGSARYGKVRLVRLAWHVRVDVGYA